MNENITPNGSWYIYIGKIFKGIYHEHLVEAIVLAIIAALAIEFFKKPFRTLYKKIIGRKIDSYKKKRKLRIEIPLHETEILQSIKTNANPAVSPEIIAGSIKKHNALIVPKRFHYTDPTGKYHLCRKFNLLVLLNGEEVLVDTICKKMYSTLSSTVQFSNIAFTLSLRKETNKFFSSKIFAKNCTQRTRNHFLDYMEDGEIQYNDGDSIEGTSVVLLESFVISPEIIKSTILKIQKLGGKVEGIVILFCDTSLDIDFSSCRIKQENVIIANFIDLKLSEVRNTTCFKATKRLKYSDY